MFMFLKFMLIYHYRYYWYGNYLFKYISKEKQTESLSEKLCQRFHIAE